MFCDRCGSPVAPSAFQCPRCGAALVAGQSLPAVPRGPSAWVADGWTAVTGNFWAFVFLGFLYIASGATVPVLLQGPVAMGLQWAALRQVCGSRADVNDLSYGFQLFPQAVLISLVAGLIITFASVLLVIPGIIAVTLLQFPCLLVIDRKLDFWSAIKESAQVSQRHFGSLLILILIELGILLGGLLLCGFGVLVAIPLIHAATAAAYLDLFGLRPETRNRVITRGGQG